MPGVLTGCQRTVMAGRAGTKHLIVIHVANGGPYIGAVAILANIRRLYMKRALAGRVRAVVTTHAVVHNIGMVKISWHPGDRRVAVIAVIAAGYVGWVFTDGCKAIVAGITGTANLRVVDGVGWHPDVGRVTVFADLRRLDMGRVFAGCVGTIVATGAITRDVYVVKIRRQPANSGVTVIAVVAAIDMCRVLASCGQSIMTGATCADCLGVINGENGVPHI